MSDIDDIKSLNASFDIRVETLAAALLSKSAGVKDSFGLEQVVVSPQGTLKRRSSHEVKSVRTKEYEGDRVLFIEVHRKGLFDTLPDGLFLRREENYDSPKERTKAFDQQKKEARKFFLPFEQAFYLPRILAEQLEQEWTEHFPEFFTRIWGLDTFADCLNDRQRFLLCYLIPEAHRVVGNWELTGLCFEAVLQKPVELGFKAPLEYPIPEQAGLSADYSLGEGAMLGGSFRDELPALEVRVKGVTFRELDEFLPGGKTRQLLEELLYNYFLPLDVPVTTEIKVTEDSWGFVLKEAVLGYNVQLK